MLGKTSVVCTSSHRGHGISTLLSMKEKQGRKFSTSHHKLIQSSPWEEKWLIWRVCLEEVVKLVKLSFCWFFFLIALVEAAWSPAQPKTEGQVCLIESWNIGESFGLPPLWHVLQSRDCWLWCLISSLVTAWGCRSLKLSFLLKTTSGEEKKNFWR